MKKLLIGSSILALSVLALTSCGGSSEDLTSLRIDNVSDETKTALNLTNLGTEGKDIVGTKIYKDDRGTKKSYYDIYVDAVDPNASMFVYSKNLADIVENFDKKVKDNALANITVNTLTFTSSIYASESSSYITEFYNKKYGLTSYTLDENKTKVYNYDFGFEFEKTQSWTKTTSTMKQALNAYKDGVTDISIKTLYLPTYFVRTYKGEEILRCYIFTPVYIALVDNTTGKEIVSKKGEKYALEDSPLASYNELKLVFNDKGLLVGTE